MNEEITKEELVAELRNNIHYYVSLHYERFGKLLHVDVESQTVDIDGKSLPVTGTRIMEEL